MEQDHPNINYTQILSHLFFYTSNDPSLITKYGNISEKYNSLTKKKGQKEIFLYITEQSKANFHSSSCALIPDGL
jgi:hypothetical protein